MGCPIPVRRVVKPLWLATEDYPQSESIKILVTTYKNKTIYFNLATVLFKSLGKEDEVELISESAVAIVNGLTDERRDSGPSEAILLHSASQLLITSVNLPLSSPMSTCNA